MVPRSLAGRDRRVRRLHAGGRHWGAETCPHLRLQRADAPRPTGGLVGIRPSPRTAAPARPAPRTRRDHVADRLSCLGGLLSSGRQQGPAPAGHLGRLLHRGTTPRHRGARPRDAVADLGPPRDARRRHRDRGRHRPRRAVRPPRARARCRRRVDRHAQPPDPQHRRPDADLVSSAPVVGGSAAVDRDARARRGDPHRRQPRLRVRGRPEHVRRRALGNARLERRGHRRAPCREHADPARRPARTPAAQPRVSLVIRSDRPGCFLSRSAGSYSPAASLATA